MDVPHSQDATAFGQLVPVSNVVRAADKDQKQAFKVFGAGGANHERKAEDETAN